MIIKRFTVLLLLLITCLYSCRKNEAIKYKRSDVAGQNPEGAQVATGKIIGMISPAEASQEVRVSYFLNGKAVVITSVPDNLGHFVFSNIVPGEYSLSFTAAPGYIVPTDKTIALKSGEAIDAGTAIFTTSVGGSLKGAVLPAGAALIASLNANVNGIPVAYKALPDQDGSFQFTGLPVATYMLTFTPASGYIAPGDAKVVTVAPGKLFDIGSTMFAASAGGSINGVINPAGAVSTITASTILNKQTLTYKSTPTSTGSFNIDNLPAGSYTLSYTTNSGFNPPANSTVNVTSGQAANVGTVSFSASQQSGIITGILDRPTVVIGIVAANINNIYKWYYAAINAASGKFEITGLPAGTYLLNYSTKPLGSYYAPATTNITVTAGQNTDIGLIKISDAIPGSISGTVSPAGSVESVVATSESTGIQYKTIPDGNGNFKVSDLPFGKYFVNATPASGSNLHAPYRKAIGISNGQHLNMGNIALSVDIPPFPVAFTVDGVNYTTQSGIVDSYYSSGNFGVNSSMGSYRMIITLSGVAGIGEYACKPGTVSKISFSKISPPSGLTNGKMPTLGGVGAWTTAGPGAEGVVKIITIDQASKMISGTFSAKLTAGGTLGGTLLAKTVTNGRFHVPYQ